MSDEELPSVAPKDAVCYIDFSFTMPYHEPLKNASLLQECISSATNEVLHPLSLPSDEIQISEIALKPNDINPKRINVGGWFKCKDQQRQNYMNGLRLAQKSKKISKQIIDRTEIKRNKVSIQGFTTTFSNAEHVEKGQLNYAKEVHDKYKTRQNSTESTPKITINKNPNNENNNDTNDTNDNKDNNENNNEQQQEQNDDDNTEETPPLTHLLEGAASVVVRDDIANVDPFASIETKGDDEEEYDVISKPSTQENDESFQMVDGLNDTEDQSSNEEDKAETSDTSSKSEAIATDTLAIEIATGKLDVVTDKLENATDLDDFTSVTPIVPGVRTLIGTPSKARDEHGNELSKLRSELSNLKSAHADELDHFKNRITTLKKQNTVQRRKSNMSVLVDKEIIRKQIQQHTDDKVIELESELYASKEDMNLELERVQLRHQRELKNLETQVRQTQEHHALELHNIRKTHQEQTEQLQSQIRALTGSLERESQKDRKIYDLTEEIEQLKVDKERTVQNYESVLVKLNQESEENIQSEINKRVREQGNYKREIASLQQSLNREQKKIRRLSGEIKQLQDENVQVNSVLSKMKKMFLNEKKRVGTLERKLMKSKRNLYQTKEEKQNERNQEMLAKGKHLRKKSKTFKNRTVTMSKLITGDNVIEIERNDDDPMAFENIMAFASEYDGDFNTDSDYDENDVKEEDMVNKHQYNDEIAVKEQQIASLKSKITNLNCKIDALNHEKYEEVQSLQLAIGSLQRKMEMQDENFLKQNQMLEFKLNQKENYAKKLEDDLQELTREHRKEIRMLNDEIQKSQGGLIEKEREIITLGENLDLIEEENARLKDVEEDYVAEMEEIDDHYQSMIDDMRLENEDTTKQLEVDLQQRDEETNHLKDKVHAQSNSIAELQSVLNNMKLKEIEIMNKEAEIKKSEQESEDSEWRGQQQADSQPYIPQTPVVDKENYILRQEMEQIISDKVEQIRMQHAVDLDSIKDRYLKEQQEEKNKEIQLNDKINRLNDHNNEINNELNQANSRRDRMEAQLGAAEKSRIQLLTTFTKEIDRMRDEIRKLNGNKQEQNQETL